MALNSLKLFLDSCRFSHFAMDRLELSLIPGNKSWCSFPPQSLSVYSHCLWKFCADCVCPYHLDKYSLSLSCVPNDDFVICFGDWSMFVERVDDFSQSRNISIVRFRILDNTIPIHLDSQVIKITFVKIWQSHINISWVQWLQNYAGIEKTDEQARRLS